MTHCRIGKVTLKAAPDLVVLKNHNDFSPKLMSYARHLCDKFARDTDGFVILCWDSEGSYDIGYSIGKKIITPSLMPSWVHDILMREVTELGTVSTLKRDGLI